jgi:hypothetical protein
MIKQMFFRSGIYGNAARDYVTAAQCKIVRLETGDFRLTFRSRPDESVVVPISNVKCWIEDKVDKVDKKEPPTFPPPPQKRGPGRPRKSPEA